MKILLSFTAAIAFFANVEITHADDWISLENEIHSEIVRSNSLYAVTNSQVIETLIKTHQESMLLEMCFQSQHPYIALAGLSGLYAINTNAAFVATLHLAWCNDVKTFVWLAPVFMTQLTNEVDATLFNTNMSSLMKLMPRDRGASDSLINCLIAAHPEMILKWFENEDCSEDLPSNVCLILESISINIKPGAGKVSEKMKRSLEAYKKIPGVPRLTYYELYPAEDEVFREELLSELQSETISDYDLNILIRFRSSMAKELLKKHSNSMSAHKIDLLKSALGEQ